MDWAEGGSPGEALDLNNAFLLDDWFAEDESKGLEEVIETGEPEDDAFDPALGTWSRDSALISISGHGRFPAPDGLSHCEDNAMSYAMVGRVKLDIERRPASSIPAD